MLPSAPDGHWSLGSDRHGCSLGTTTVDSQLQATQNRPVILAYRVDSVVWEWDTFVEDELQEAPYPCVSTLRLIFERSHFGAISFSQRRD